MPRGEKLKVIAEERKKDTLNKIQNAINFIKSDGGIVTKSKLLELTGLSSSVFSSKHVKDLLKQNKVCQYLSNSIIIKDDMDLFISNLENEILKNEKGIKLLSSRLNDKDIIIEKKNLQINELKIEIENIKTENMMIMGKLQIVLMEINHMGIKLNTGFDIL